MLSRRSQDLSNHSTGMQKSGRHNPHSSHHNPVMLGEMIEALMPVCGGYYADVTYGCGGYSKAIHSVSGVKLFALDRDPYAVSVGAQDSCVSMHHAKFSQLHTLIKPRSLDGLVADLGVSSPQIDSAARGFSFNKKGPLDMQMGLCEVSALELIRRTPESELVLILRVYGEEPRARAIARALVENRDKLETTEDLANLVAAKTSHPKRHPATRTFQALRIAVNDELRELDCLMQQAKGWLKDGGRIVVVSFHSLEDRMVKRALAGYGVCGRILPSEGEVKINVRARSAVLRWAQTGRCSKG